MTEEEIIQHFEPLLPDKTVKIVKVNRCFDISKVLKLQQEFDELKDWESKLVKFANEHDQDPQYSSLERIEGTLNVQLPKKQHFIPSIKRCFKGGVWNMNLK